MKRSMINYPHTTCPELVSGRECLPAGETGICEVPSGKNIKTKNIRMKIKHITRLLLLSAILVAAGCKKEYIDVDNTVITPDLSNPIIQSVSNKTWYVVENSVKFPWETLDNTPSMAENMSVVLYGLAWKSISFYRDGTVDMVFRPPFFPSSFIHGLGTWQVSKTEENTIIMNLKTPVSNVNATFKVLNLETKDQVALMNVSMDQGNMVITANLANSTTQFSANQLEAIDYNWFATREVLKTPLDAGEFTGTTWTTASYNYPLTEVPDEKQNLTQITYVENLLTATPVSLWGVELNLLKDGKAAIAYNNQLMKDLWDGGKKIVSDATWSVKGNKIWITSDEQLFFSVGEYMFGIQVYGNNLVFHGTKNGDPLRTQTACYYAIELIERTAEGFWARVTTHDATFYTFLFRSETDLGNTINIKEAFKK